MRLDTIDFGEIEELQLRLDWGSDNPDLLRKFYRGKGLFYKIWGERYFVNDYAIDGDRYVKHVYRNPTSGLALIDAGLVTKDTCSALIDLIWDSSDRCRGYVMLEGSPVDTADKSYERFVEYFCELSLSTGFLHSDFAPKNLISVNGRPNLIDLDTVPSRIENVDFDFEISQGSFRPHVTPRYRTRMMEICLEEAWRKLAIDRRKLEDCQATELRGETAIPTPASPQNFEALQSDLSLEKRSAILQRAELMRLSALQTQGS